MSTDHCTFVNGLCPDDLCVLPYGHPFSSRNRHITGTTYGSADTSYREQIQILREGVVCQWPAVSTYQAPRGTPVKQLVKLGWKLQGLSDRKADRRAKAAAKPSRKAAAK